MQSRTARARNTGIAILGTLALASTLLLAGCGGGSSTESTAAASAEAVSAEPPRPGGLTDEEWAAVLKESAIGNSDTKIAELQAKTPEDLAARCQKPPLTDEERQAFAEQVVIQYPSTTAEEWIPFLDWGLAQMQIALDTVCANVPAEGAGSSDTGSSDTGSSDTGSTGSVNPAAVGTLADAAAAAAAAAVTCDGSSVPCQLGNTGPGGGLVFYVDPAGFACDDGATCTALEGAPAGWSGEANDPPGVWCMEDQPGFALLSTDGGTYDAFSTTIGTGLANTRAIVEACGPATAAGAASAYTGGGQDDWYLPSTGEMHLLARKMFDTGSTQTWNGLNNGGVYWVSSQSDPDFGGSPNAAYNVGVPFVEGNGAIASVKTESYFIHPVRAF